MTERETIEIRLVPVADEDTFIIEEAISYLMAFNRLLNPKDSDPWIGTETINGLRRLHERIRSYGYTYKMPMPVTRGTQYMKADTPLFAGEEAADE